MCQQKGIVIYPTPEIERDLGTGEKENWQPNDIKTIKFITPEGDKVHEVISIDYIPDTTTDGQAIIDYDVYGNQFQGYTIHIGIK